LERQREGFGHSKPVVHLSSGGIENQKQSA